MNKYAIVQARQRVERARLAITEMRAAKTYDEVRRTWFDYLQAANGVFVKLQKGAQNHGKTRGWWSRLVKRRADDPLLSYIHHARRVEEHCLGHSVEMNAPVMEQVADDYAVPDDRKGKELLMRLPGMKPVKVTLPTGLQLKEIVDDQYGDVFPLPTSHLGQPIGRMSVPDLAELALGTLEHIIDEAEQYVQEEPRKSSRDKRTQGQG